MQKPTRLIVKSLFLFVPFLTANAYAATSVFNSDAEDWRVFGFTQGAVFDSDLGLAEFDPTFGISPSGMGSITATDPGDDVGARFGAPGAFLGNLSAFVGGQLSFDLIIRENDGPKELDRVPGIVIFVNNAVGKALGFTDVLPTTSPATTSTYTVPLMANNIVPGSPVPALDSWIVFNPSNPFAFQQASAADFTEVFANVTQLTITGEVTSSTDDTLGLDNVNLSAVPAPAALPLLGSAFLGLLAAARRRLV